jgi:para-aminobenzoate synthetase component 1
MNDFFQNYTYAFIKKNEIEKESFDVFLSDSLSDINHDLKDHIAFVNYDYKNELESFSYKKNNPLLFPNLVFAKVEKKRISHLEFLNPEKKDSKKIIVKATVSKEEYIKKVHELKNHIQLGDIYEINYCITFESQEVEINPLDIFKKLYQISEAPFSCLMKIDNKYIISSSPELYISKKGNTLITKPIKGTAQRGITESEDLVYKNTLKESLKEKTENVMIVDVCRNDLSRVAEKGTVSVDKLFDIESYKQVHQMVSTIKCELKNSKSFKDILNTTFPMASMTGAPKKTAMELIDEFEFYNRGPYSGAVGYIDREGNFEFSVLIRSIFYDAKKSYLSFSVGSAITAMCDAEDEYEECLLKAKAMIQVLSGIGE